jgi:hypothetical protein
LTTPRRSPECAANDRLSRTYASRAKKEALDLHAALDRGRPGIWYVLHAMWFRDHVTVLADGSDNTQEVALAAPAMEESATFKIVWTDSSIREIPRDRVIRRVPEREKVTLNGDGQPNVIGVTGEGDNVFPILLQLPGHRPYWVDRDQTG